MGTDPTSIWERGLPRRRRPIPASPPAAPAAAPAHRPVEDRPAGPTRITLKEAARRHAVSVATLRAWSRAGEIDAVMAGGPQGRRWMVTPASVAARKRRRTLPASAPAGSGPDASAMLVPRDAWDRLLAQLGNLHQAGQQLAEARERAAKAETEAAFLRERLAEIRQERDLLRQHFGTAPPAGGAPPRRFHLAFSRRRGRS